MKINILHNHVVFAEVLEHLCETLQKQGHQTQITDQFLYDDSNLTLSTGFLNILDTLQSIDRSKYKGKLIHWLVEIFPPDDRQTHTSELRINQFKTIQDKFDHIFVRDPRQIGQMKKILGIKPAGILSCCPNPKLHKKIPTEKKYDVLFYGNMSDHRINTLKTLKEKGINVYCPSGYIWREEKIQAINESKIILNVHWDKTNVFETFRINECLASGGFLLSEHFEWYPDERLIEGRDFIMCPYDQIVDQVQYYLKNYHEARRIADSGKRTIEINFKWEEEFEKIEHLLGWKTPHNNILTDDRTFFILGCQRSGTTLIELMLDSHPDTACFGEPGVYEKIEYRNPEPKDKRIGAKMPMWTWKTEWFQKYFPRSKYIFMERDHRAIIASLMGLKGWAEGELKGELQSLQKALKSPQRDLLNGYMDKALQDNAYGITLLIYLKRQLYEEYEKRGLDILRVQYENLVTKPEETMRRVLEFLELPWDDTVLRHHETHQGVYMGGTDSQRPVDQSSLQKWKKTLYEADQTAIELLFEKWDKELNKCPELVCPICEGTEFTPFPKRPEYKICRNCGLHRQKSLPDKVYEGPEENFGMGPGTGDQMSDTDKQKNQTLADNLYAQFRPRKVMDIGSKYPYLLHCLKDRCEVLGIDGIPEILKYGEELGVVTLQMDIEKGDVAQQKNRYDLITMVHMMEHLYNIRGSTEKILSCLSDRGTLFIRTPNPEVGGIERDLTNHHLTIHPYLHTRKSIEALFKPFGYEVFKQVDHCGFGQSDYYIKKDNRGDHSLSVVMIVKNEEKNIRDCLDSLKGVYDELIVVDTGSEDKTKEVVAEYGAKVYDFKWIDDFSAARNFALDKATKAWIMWCDADDLLEHAPKVTEAIRSGSHDAYNFNIIYGNDTFTHVRLFRNNIGVHFKGRVHECPITYGLRLKEHTDINVIHKTHKHSTENRTLRNLRILRKEVAESPDSPRALFYLGNTLRELRQFDEALETYDRYLGLSTWQDERFQALKYKGQILMAKKEYRQAQREFLTAIFEDGKWREGPYYAGECAFYMGQYQQCIAWMNMCLALPVPQTTLWIEMALYRDLPYRYLFAAYECMGDYDKAIKYCEKAIEENPGDEWLKKRLEHFRKKQRDSVSDPVNEHVKAPRTAEGRHIIELCRQGALGDVLMTTAAVRAVREQYPDSWIRYVVHEKCVEILEGNPYIDEISTTHDGGAHKRIMFSYPESEGYPEKPLDRHLVQIFNECAEVPAAGMKTEIYLSDKDEEYGQRLQEQYGNYVTLHAQAGWSKYKEWPDERWQEVVEWLFKKGYPVLQLGLPSDRVLSNTVDLRGTTIKQMAAAIKYAKFHMGVDSVSNHMTNAVGTQGLILFGSTSPTGSGYTQNINVYKGFDCQPCYKEYQWAPGYRGECEEDHRCMMSVSVEDVISVSIHVSIHASI